MFRVHHRSLEEARRNIPYRTFDTEIAQEAFDFQRKHQNAQDEIVWVVYKPKKDDQ